MTGEPRILIFDDEPDWATQIALSLKGFDTSTISNPDDWNLHISGSRWDAIIVDVNILGADSSGPEYAERSILEYHVTAPIIIISGVIDLKKVEAKYGRIFSAYVHKDNCIEELPWSGPRAL